MATNIININENLQELNATKDKIDKSIASIESKKKLVESTITVISPSSRLDIEIKELELEKQIAVLRKEKRSTDIRYQYSFGNITFDELNKQLAQNEIDSVTEQKNLDDQIVILKKQKESQKNPYKNITTKEQRLKSTKSKIKSEIKAKRTQAVSKLSSTVIKKGVETAIAATLSRIVQSQSSNANKKLAALDAMVDRVNAQIDAIQTVDDIAKARVARNNALRILNDVESRLQHLDKVLKTVETVAKVLLLVIEILTIAIKFIFLPGPKALAKLKLDQITRILVAILIIVAVARVILENLISIVEAIKARLKDIGNLLDILSTDTTKLNAEDLNKLIGNNYGKLGILDVTYKGFRFAIKEEFDKRYVVQGHKRRYAVALNRDNSEVVKSEYSFTLDPDVLVEQIKIVIDQQELKP